MLLRLGCIIWGRHWCLFARDIRTARAGDYVLRMLRLIYGHVLTGNYESRSDLRILCMVGCSLRSTWLSALEVRLASA